MVIARREDSGDQLLGYVVTAPDGPAEQALREALQAQLPDYMVPSRIIVLDALPLNPNGKVDRKALPQPGASERHYQAPRNLAEQALVEVWQEVLGVERIGVTDNFFELGGDSLRILKVLGKLRGRSDLGLELKLRDLMTRPTIAQLSGYDEQQEAALDPLLLLNSPSPTRPALFCLHAGFGTVFDYEPLARQLEGRHSVYGLQCRMLLDRDWQDDSLQGMAIDYAQYIRQKQADGPYLLLGWSLGGTLAVLVAEELRRQGQEVGFVGLVDSFIPGQGASLVDDDEELRSFLAVTLQCDAEQLPAVVCPQPLKVTALAETIGQVQAQLASATGFDAQDLAQGFVVAMRLKALSEQQGDLPALDVPIHCWWAGDAASQAAVAAFEAGLGQVAQRHWLNTTHFAIPRHAALLRAVHEYLGSLETIAG